MKTKIISITTICIIFFVSGYLISKMANFPGISVQKEINPLHFLSILSTLAIAIFLSIVIENQKEKRKTEKELIYRRIGDTIKIADKIHEKIERLSIPISSANSINKRIRTSVKSIFDALNLTKINVGTDIKDIDALIKDIQDIMTGTPIITSGADKTPPVKVVEDTIFYNINRLSEIDTKVENLKNTLFSLQIEINRA